VGRVLGASWVLLNPSPTTLLSSLLTCLHAVWVKFWGYKQQPEPVKSMSAGACHPFLRMCFVPGCFYPMCLVTCVCYTCTSSLVCQGWRTTIDPRSRAQVLLEPGARWA
jgi:hypothetical protein